MNERKRVILITNAFPFGRGEASFILPELRYLCDGMEVSIVSRNCSDSQTSNLPEGIEVFRYNAQAVGMFDLAKYIPRLLDMAVLKEIIRYMKKPKDVLKTIKMVLRGAHFSEYVKQIRRKYEQPIVYYTYWNDYATYGISRFCDKKKDKVISRIHGGDLYLRPTNGYCLPLKKEIARLIDRICFISEEGCGYFAQTYTARYSDKYDVYRMGITNEYGIGKGSQDDILRIVSVSNVVFGKRVALIPEALSFIKERTIEWTHFGDGDEMQQVIEAIKKTGSNIRCKLMGSVSNDEIMEYYSTTPVDLFVNVSYSEGLPVSMMEAASFGIPLVGTDVGAVREIITPDNGYLLSRDFLCQELAELLNDFAVMPPEHKNALRECSRRVWSRSFVADDNYARFANMIRQL